MKKTLLALALLAFVVLPSQALSAPITGTFTLGGATTGTGPYDMTSTDSTFSVLRFVLNTPIDFNDFASLSYNYDSLQGGIGGGAPRAVFVTDADHDNIADGSFDVQWGPAGTFVDGTLGAGLSTGNLLALMDNGRYDLTGIGGSVYTDRTTALSMAGAYSILRVSLILDSFGGNDRHFIINDVSAESNAAAVPEPTTLVMFGTGLLGLAYRVRQRTT